MKTETFTFFKTKVLDIDTFVTTKDEKTFDLETVKKLLKKSLQKHLTN